MSSPELAHKKTPKSSGLTSTESVDDSVEALGQKVFFGDRLEVISNVLGSRHNVYLNHIETVVNTW